MYTNTSIVEAFNNGATQGEANTMFIEGNVLYSYGHHFPLAIRLKSGHHLINGDKYSVTTSQHQSMCISYLNSAFEIPLSACKGFLKTSLYYEYGEKIHNDFKFIQFAVKGVTKPTDSACCEVLLRPLDDP